MAVSAEVRRNASLVWVAGGLFAVALLVLTDFARPLSAQETAALEGLRGVGAVGLPVSIWDAPPWVVRGYFVVLSSSVLVAAFRRWARPAAKVAWTAAAMFAVSWVPLASGGTVQPHLLAALAAVLAAGFAMRWCVERDRGALVGVGAGVAAAALLVPLSGVALAVGLVVVVVVWVRRRALPAVASVAVGAVVGVLPAVAMPGFGVLAGGVGGATDIAGAVAQYLRVVDGPLRPAAGGGLTVGAVVWVVVLAALAATGILQRRWNHRRNASLVGVTVSAALVVPYVLLDLPVDARNVLPAYALLIVAAAAGVLDLWHIVGRRIRSPLVTIGLAALMGGAVLWQLSLAARHG